MTRGNIPRTLIGFSIPLILSGMLQQLYTWADALIVGNVLGEASLAAVGASGTLSTFFVVILSGFAVGISILTSHAFGETDYRSVSRITSTFSVVTGIVAVLLSLIGLVFVAPLLRILNTPAEIADKAERYLSCLFLGIPFMGIYNIYSAVLRGIGDSKIPFYAIVVSSILNILLDICFLTWGKMQVEGAAIATVISQATMVCFVVVYASRKYEMIRFRFRRGCVDGETLKKGLALAIPTLVQSSVRSLGGLTLQSIMNSFGTIVVAGVTTAYRIDSIALLPLVNLGSGISTFTAQNVGAGDVKRAKQGMKMGLVMSVGVAVAITAIIIPLSGMLMRLFGVSEKAIVIGRDLLFALSAFYPLFGVINAMTGYLQGMDDVFFAGVISIAGLGARITLSYILRPFMGSGVIAVSELISWALTAAALFLRYYYMFSQRRIRRK